MTEKQRFGIGRPSWRPPSFPPGFPSMVHSPDRFSHQNYVQPEVLLAAIAAASTAQQVLNERNSRTAYLPNMTSMNNSFTCPNCTYAMPNDLISLGVGVNASGSASGQSFHHHHHYNSHMQTGHVPTQLPSLPPQQSPHSLAFKRNSVSPGFGANVINTDRGRRYSGTNNFYGSISTSPSVFPTQRQMQKTRKPYFMPYISEGSMLRGLKNGDFLKGTLRINRHNYEESYIEVACGNTENTNNNNANESCMSSGDTLESASPKTTHPTSRKVLLLSVHDRNRALHGDEVVIRIKDRSEWLVREAMYQSWRSGELNALFDENGQPISVPPLKVTENDVSTENAGAENENLQFLPLSLRKRVPVNKQPVLIPKNGRYSTDLILQLGFLLEYCRREYNYKIEPSEEVKKLLSSLSIVRDSSSNKVNDLNAANLLHGRYHVSGHGSQRTTYRLLSDMPDDDWGIPDICLQKTAEVVYIFKARNSREAVGQLKVMADGNHNWALFSPTDSRMPRMMVPADQLPPGFFERTAEYAKMLFVAQIVEWAATAQFARGKLLRQISVTEEGGGGVGDGDTTTETKGKGESTSGSSSSFSYSPTNVFN